MFDSSNQRNKYLSKRSLDKETLEAELLKQKEAIEAAKREHELELDSILNFIAKSLQPVINVHSSLYADVNGLLDPSIITGENYNCTLKNTNKVSIIIIIIIIKSTPATLGVQDFAKDSGYTQ